MRYFAFWHLFWTIGRNKILKNTDIISYINDNTKLKEVKRISSLDPKDKGVSISKKVYGTLIEYFNIGVDINTILNKIYNEFFIYYNSKGTLKEELDKIVKETFNTNIEKLQILDNFTNIKTFDGLVKNIIDLKRKTVRYNIKINILNFSSGTDLKIKRHEWDSYLTNLHVHFSLFGYIETDKLDKDVKKIVNTIIYLVFFIASLRFIFSIKDNILIKRKGLDKFTKITEKFIEYDKNGIPICKSFIIGYYFGNKIRKEVENYILDGINKNRVFWDRLTLKEVEGRIELVNPSKYILNIFKGSFGDVKKTFKKKSWWYRFPLKHTKIIAKSKSNKENKRKLLNELIEKSKCFKGESSKIKTREIVYQILSECNNEGEFISKLSDFVNKLWTYQNLFGLAYIHSILDFYNKSKNFGEFKSELLSKLRKDFPIKKIAKCKEGKNNQNRDQNKEQNQKRNTDTNKKEDDTTNKETKRRRKYGFKWDI